MTKNLSKQICEKCGIEYCFQSAIISELPTWHHELVLDFGQPENFVKLLNIIYTCGINQRYDYQLATLACDEDDYGFYFDNEPETFQKRYLNVLLIKLSKDYDTWDKNFIAKVTQAIRWAEWKYE